VIVGVRNILKNGLKFIYKDGLAHKSNNINAYLLNADNVYIKERSKPISKIPEMYFGSMPNDGGHLLISENEYLDIKNKMPEALGYVKRILGGQEFIKSINRYCLWINADSVKSAQDISLIKSRIDSVQKYRNSSKRGATKKLASVPYRFGEVRHQETNSIIVPRVSSEKREYIPFGFLDKDSVITDSAQAIYNAEPWIFGVISSRMHMTWVRAVAGRLKTDYRYSSALCYNTFPIPQITQKQKDEITRHVYLILEERENNSEKTMAQLYDPQKMPKGLREAHHNLDLAIERCYRSKPFGSDEDRLEYLFKLYEQMIVDEKQNNN